ncbi:HpcH/HpaI aldolase/citrate lyase family protein [Halomarina salina]|uniref:HpcH/HpaI aldolase/citrate lyase family protein n=1 Tax=Halomarina salina TaxID=1872699 RepID=A0ABD5RLX4_9EURY|nr:aldolase/citrate lyase family protein [Halomarina salina]
MTRLSTENGLKRTLDAGDVAFGVFDGLYSPTTVELYGEFGFDFVWLDLEHAGPSPLDAPTVESLLRAADAVGMELLVRLPSTDPWMVRKALDAGVRTAFVSRVETAQETRRVVEAARFTYDDEPGQRGLAAPRASRWGRVDDYPATEDRETLLGVTVESLRAVEHIDDILAVPDLGFVFVGPLDLSVSTGHPGEIDHPDVQAAVETIRDSCLDHGVPLGNLTFGMEDVHRKVDEGYQLLNVGSTTAALEETLGGWHEAYRGEG